MRTFISSIIAASVAAQGNYFNTSNSAVKYHPVEKKGLFCDAGITHNIYKLEAPAKSGFGPVEECARMTRTPLFYTLVTKTRSECYSASYDDHRSKKCRKWSKRQGWRLYALGPSPAEKAAK